MRSEALRPAIVWSLLATALVALPIALVLVSCLSGELPDREAWFAQSNHGPWRWELSGLTVLAAIYGLLATTAGSFLHGIISAARHRNGRSVLPFLAACLLSALLLHLVLSRLFWLID